MVKYKKKDVFYLVSVVVSTAVVFFTAGAFTADFLETTRPDTTVIEYVPATAPTTITTTNSPTTTLTTAESATTTTAPTASTTTTAEANVTTTSTSVSNTTAKTGKININTATKEELMTISGIGEVYATRIIEYRELIGHFTCLEELLEIKGIGEKRLAKWEPFLTL